MKRFYLLLTCCLLSVILFAQGDYLNQRADQYSKLPHTPDDIIFLGNSITHFGEWQEFFPEQRIKNRGIASNRADMILDRMGPILKGKPKAIFIKIGVNDLSDKNYTAESLITNYELIIERIKKESPSTKIFMQSVLPINKANIAESEKAIPTNAALKEICARTGAIFINLWPHFTASETNNNLKPTWSNDMVHLMGVGYAKWAELVAQQVGSISSLRTPTEDYRPISGAAAYVNQRTSLFELITSETNDDIFMFGDDAIWAGLWDELLQNKKVKNRGFNASSKSGSDLSYLNKSVEKWLDSHPKQFWIYAGSNDLFDYNKDQSFVLTQIGEVVKTVKSKSPKTEIFVQSLLPRNNAAQSQAVLSINEALKSYCNTTEGVTYVEIHAALKNSDNNINSSYTTNGLALNTLGYMAWCEAIAPFMGTEVTPVQAESSLNAAHYNTSIVSKATNPVWFFIMAQGVTKKVIEQASSDNTVNCTAIPLSSNTSNQFWRIEAAENEKYYIINKATAQYLTVDGQMTNQPTALNIRAIGHNITIGDGGSYIYENGETLSARSANSNGSSQFIFVKAPIGGADSPTWYQFKNERTSGTLTLTDNYLNHTTNTTTPVFSDPNRFFRLKFHDTEKAFNIVPMGHRTKAVPVIAENTIYSAVSVVSETDPLMLVLTPFETGKSALYKQGTLSGMNGIRFDFSGTGSTSSTGLYNRSLTHANGKYDFLEYETSISEPIYPLVIEGPYALQYKGLFTGTKINWFAANTLINNRSDLLGKTQLVSDYSASYALWEIKKEENGKYSIRNNRAETLAEGGDFISITGEVCPASDFTTADIDTKTFALFMNTETFDPSISRIAIKSASAEAYLYPVSAKNNTNEALIFNTSASGSSACYFQIHPIIENRALAQKINEATKLYHSTQEEANEGKYTIAARNSFQTAILKANKVLNKLTATETEVATAKTEIEQAMDTYEKSKVITGLTEHSEQFRIQVINGYITSNISEAKIRVFNTFGVEIDPSQRLANGIFIVQAYGKTFKIIAQ